MQDIYNLAAPSVDCANVVCVLGPPGCGKTALMIDTIAAAVSGTPYRRAMLDEPNVPAPFVCNEKEAKLIVHKATLTANCGHPAETLAAAMQEAQWQPGEGVDEPKYSTAGARVVGRHTFHCMEECQAWVNLLPGCIKRHQQARTQIGRSAAPAALLRDCPHVFSFDPLQSSCRTIGVDSVQRDGTVSFKASKVVMPWEMLWTVLGAPSATMRWAFVVVHGQWRMKGLLFRLLRNVYDPMPRVVAFIPTHACPLPVCRRPRACA